MQQQNWYHINIDKRTVVIQSIVNKVNKNEYACLLASTIVIVINYWLSKSNSIKANQTVNCWDTFTLEQVG